MKYRSFIIIIFFLFTVKAAFTQSFRYETSIGQFEEAHAFAVSAEGYFFVTDIYTHEVLKLDTLGNMITKNGGYGWENELLNDPVDIYVTPLSVMVTDYNNSAIKQYDRMLNFISLKNGESPVHNSESFAFPLSCALSPNGDMYILDSDNGTVKMYDFNGNFRMKFGGYDYGMYSLENPFHLTIDRNSNVYVLDQYKVLVFDSFGIGIDIIELDELYTDITSYGDNIFITNESSVAKYDKLNHRFSNIELLYGNHYDGPHYASALMYNNKLYVLTTGTILIFTPIKK